MTGALLRGLPLPSWPELAIPQKCKQPRLMRHGRPLAGAYLPLRRCLGGRAVLPFPGRDTRLRCALSCAQRKRVSSPHCLAYRAAGFCNAMMRRSCRSFVSSSSPARCNGRLRQRCDRQRAAEWRARWVGEQGAESQAGAMLMAGLGRGRREEHLQRVLQLVLVNSKVGGVAVRGGRERALKPNWPAGNSTREHCKDVHGSGCSLTRCARACTGFGSSRQCLAGWDID